MSNLIKRTVPVLLVLVLCATCLVSPASAATESTMYDLLDYSTLDDTGSNYVVFNNSSTVFYSVPNRSVIRYVDMTISMVGAVSEVSVGPNPNLLVPLTVEHIDGYLYRVYGSISSLTFSSFCINFDSGSSSNSWYTIHSIKVSTSEVSPVRSLGSLWVYDSVGGSSSVSMSSPTDEPEIYLSQDTGATVSYADFACSVSLSEWKKFDYLDVLLYLDVEHINSIFAKHGSISLDCDISYLTPADQINTYYWVMVHVDLSSADRSSSVVPTIELTGTYYNQVNYNKIRLKSITGLVSIPDPSPLLSYWYNLRSFLSTNFNTLFAKIDLAFGLDDNSASSAQQTQEEINVSVNNQLVGAVEDWNTHIEVVETGYDLAFTKTTPALDWIASLANGIYSGLGWFGRLYLLIGLVSVFMLVLSKSGLSRKIGSSIRRSG